MARWMRAGLAAAMLLLLVVVAEAASDPAAPATEAASVLGLVEEARAKAAGGDWKEASALWERVVKLNPVEPDYWFSLATSRYRNKDYRTAIAAYEQAAALGAPVGGAYHAVYQIACCHALLGEKEQAIAALERAFWLGYPNHDRMAQAPELATVREDPRVVALLKLQPVAGLSRDEGWRHDLAVLAREVRRKGFNPHLDVQRSVSLEQFDARVAELDRAIPGLSDGQVVLELMKLMVFVGDGHSAVFDLGENPLFRAALPLRLFWFEEGLFVTAADPKYRELLGAKVEAFDGRPADAVLEALEPYVNCDRGNPMKARVSLPYRVRKLSLLHAAGLIEQPDRVKLTVVDLAGTRREAVVEADGRETEIWNKLPAPASWVTFASTLDAPPLYLKDMGTAQWFEYLAPHKTVYFQFNRVRDGEKESLAQFSERLLRFIEDHDVERLVIDMRWNNGGNTWLGQPLLLGVIASEKINQTGRLFVIIGRRTYSAAQNMSTYFERFTNATFVGEPTGSSPNFVGEEDPIRLPYSKVLANVSNLFWQSSWPHDQRIWIAPQIYVSPKFADFRAGRAPALEAILAVPR